jgi:hypothetical protein
MAADPSAFDEEPIPGAMPERWETAIEDAAQVIALGLDRAQDLADVINDFTRQHPTASKLILAAAGGMIVGSIIAGRTRKAPTAAERATRLAEEARANAQAAMSDLSGRMPSRRAMLERLPRIDREAVAERMPRIDRDAIAERMPRVDRDAMAERMPRIDREALASRMPSLNGNAFRRGRGGNNFDLSQARYAAQLVPIALTLLRNPLVRQFVLRSAMRAARRS